MTLVPPTPVGSYTPALAKPECSRSCCARDSASCFISSFVPKCRQPVGQLLMHAGSRPCDTRSLHSVHLNIFLVSVLNLGMLNGQPVTQYWQPMQYSCWKSTMPFWYW